jgi:hypothetical protein
MQFNSLGKVLIIAGIVFVALGVVFTLFNKIPFLGKLPGDILVKKKNLTFYFPIVTSVLLSLLFTLILYLINKFRS